MFFLSPLPWILGCTSGAPAPEDPEPPAPTTPLPSLAVHPCSDPAAALPAGWAEALGGAGLTQCAAPFGIIIGAAEEVPEAYVLMVARIVAELADPDMDGTANDPSVIDVLANGENVWLPMPTNRQQWSQQEEALGEQLDSYGIMIPRWWLGGFSEDGPDDLARAVMVEEVHHAFTQFGYGIVYPDLFGVEAWTSVIAQETQRAQCDWWQHPENSCPGVPSEGGDCSDPSCDVTEFYHQVAVVRAGMTPGWYGIGFPRDAATLEPLLSDALKAAMDNPDYNQLRQPLTFSYPVE